MGKPAPRCEWHPDGSASFWEGSCGIAWEFTDGGPKDNGFRYCPRCGKPLKIRRHGD